VSYVRWMPKINKFRFVLFETTNVIDMAEMFQYCNKLNLKGVENFDTSKVIDMSKMFNYCQKFQV